MGMVFPVVLFEELIAGEEFVWLGYLGDDGIAVDISYCFPAGDLEAAKEIVHNSLNTLLVY